MGTAVLLHLEYPLFFCSLEKPLKLINILLKNLPSKIATEKRATSIMYEDRYAVFVH